MCTNWRLFVLKLVSERITLHGGSLPLLGEWNDFCLFFLFSLRALETVDKSEMLMLGCPSEDPPECLWKAGAHQKMHTAWAVFKFQSGINNGWNNDYYTVSNELVLLIKLVALSRIVWPHYSPSSWQLLRFCLADDIMYLLGGGALPVQLRSVYHHYPIDPCIFLHIALKEAALLPDLKEYHITALWADLHPPLSQPPMIWLCSAQRNSIFYNVQCITDGRIWTCFCSYLDI